jgi:flavodoxin
VKVLIVYDSVSPSKTTAAVAFAIRDALKEKGVQVESFFVEDVDKTSVKNCDCLLAGAPTMAFKPSSGMTDFLKGLPSSDCSGKLAAAFDTQVKLFISGSAVKGIESELKKLGFDLFTKPLVTYVDGKMKENIWHLKDGEIEKAKSWAEELAKTLAR